MRWVSLSTFEQADVLEFSRRSRQMEQFLRGDFSTIKSELKKAFPNTDNLQERYIPLVQKYANELAGLYDRPAQRLFSPSPSPEVYRKLRDVYQRSKVDAAMARIERLAWTQNTVPVLVLPDRLRQVRIWPLCPWQVQVDTVDPLRASDIGAAQKVEILVPAMSVDGQVIYGTMTLTPDLAYMDFGGKKTGVMYPNDPNNISNPLGRVPVVVMRREDPESGKFYSPINEPLLSLAISLCINESDLELLVHTQAWGQKVITGAEQAHLVEEIKVGPDKVLALIKSDPMSATTPRLEIVQGQPPIAQIVGLNESRIRMLCSMLSLNADNFLRVNTSMTASARLFADEDRKQVRDKEKPKFIEFEASLCQLISNIGNLTEPLQIPVDTVPLVRHMDQIKSVDPLHEAQALAMRLSLGLDSIVDTLSEEDGLSLAEAKAKIKSNLAELQELNIDPRMASSGGGQGAAAAGGGDTKKTTDATPNTPPADPAAGA